MPGTVLVDTSFLLAIADRDDRWHLKCSAVLREARPPFVTTAAILAELFHLSLKKLRRIDVVLPLLDKSVLKIAPIESDDLSALRLLMRKYADRPMDFSDATLVHVAGREGIADILTIDHADFETYRFGRNRKFRIAPAR